jgi:SAM-dependent methyltransferase
VVKSKEENAQLIRTMWESYHPDYFECCLKSFPNYYEFFAGGGVIDDFSFPLLGDVKGLRLLDTCCAGDAVQAFSWHNLGAKVIACDISPAAIEIARNNAVKMGLDVDFQVADAQTLAPIPDNSQDVVFATYICWYEDLRLACRNWHRVLKPGGRLLYRGVHPVAAVLGEEGGKLMVEEEYFDRKPDYYQFDATPAGRKYGVNVDKPTVNFRHTLADIINAICDAGFTLERVVETKAEREGFPQLSMLPHEMAVIAKAF